MLWFGIDAEVVRRLKAAQVLFVGNSRLMFGLRPALLRPVLRRPGRALLRHGLRLPRGRPLSAGDDPPASTCGRGWSWSTPTASSAAGSARGPTSSTATRRSPPASCSWRPRPRTRPDGSFTSWCRTGSASSGCPAWACAAHFIAYRSRSDGTWDDLAVGRRHRRVRRCRSQPARSSAAAKSRRRGASRPSSTGRGARDGPDPRAVPRADARGRAGALRRAARRPAGAGRRARPDLLRQQPPQRGQRPRLDARPARHAGAAASTQAVASLPPTPES